METIKERKRLIVSIFSDEYGKLGLKDNMTLFDAQSHIRQQLDLLPERQRQSVKGTIKRLLGNATEEKRQEVLELLQESDDEDEDTNDNDENEED